MPRWALKRSPKSLRLESRNQLVTSGLLQGVQLYILYNFKWNLSRVHKPDSPVKVFNIFNGLRQNSSFSFRQEQHQSTRNQTKNSFKSKKCTKSLLAYTSLSAAWHKGLINSIYYYYYYYFIFLRKCIHKDFIHKTSTPSMKDLAATRK